MAHEDTPLRDVSEDIAAAIAAFDPPAAVTAALHAIESGAVTVPALYAEVLAPLMLEIGERWHAGEECVWQEHYASAVVATVLGALYPTVARLAAAAAPAGRTVLLACPPQEPHDLGLRMLADRFALKGWRPYFLGADVPAEEIVAAARALTPDLLVLSASTHFNRLELRDVIARIRPELPGVDIRATGYALEQTHEGWPAEELLDPDAFLEDA